MKKECVFCGNKPEEKTNEHVIPNWLIELTGKPNREIMVGLNPFNKGKYRTFSFSSFRFPACKDCNQKFSVLEDITKPIIQKILNSESLNSNEFEIILDWFDKVRTGLWLAYYNLNQNIGSIVPNFRISARIKTFDRMLCITKSNSERKRINWGGCETPIFTFTPSCFSMIINNYYFLNISYDFLFSRRIGFPFPNKRYYYEDGNQQEIEITEGFQRIIKPLLKRKFRFVGTEIYQPIFTKHLYNDFVKEYYNNLYVKENSLDYKNGVGKVFISVDASYKHYPLEYSNEWVPNKTYNDEEILNIFSKEVLVWQLYIYSLRPSLDKLSAKRKRELRKLNNLMYKTNTQLIDNINRDPNFSTPSTSKFTNNINND